VAVEASNLRLHLSTVPLLRLTLPPAQVLPLVQATRRLARSTTLRHAALQAVRTRHRVLSTPRIALSIHLLPRRKTIKKTIKRLFIALSCVSSISQKIISALRLLKKGGSIKLTFYSLAGDPAKHFSFSHQIDIIRLRN
jgi:hypothetical protein